MSYIGWWGAGHVFSVNMFFWDSDTMIAKADCGFSQDRCVPGCASEMF